MWSATAYAQSPRRAQVRSLSSATWRVRKGLLCVRSDTLLVVFRVAPSLGNVSTPRTTSRAVRCQSLLMIIVDSALNALSGGGCTVPLTLGSHQGVDCTAIQGVSDVACVSGRCVVDRCLAGYTLNHDKSYCVRNEDLQAIDTSVLASSYGLEHVPLVHREDD